MTDGVKTVVYPVKDLAAAKAVYAVLLGEPHTDEAYYAGFSDGGVEVGLDPNGFGKGMTGPVAYWHVADVRAVVAALVEAGGVLVDDVRDVGGGKLIATVRDTDGNPIGLLQPS
ncbi:VOC family protein [Longispora albida]|uniref:VOC family protein n=1 Tax=Longispora albida TaxID=203523 RepID=UPI000375DBAD|nr:VOC family protein [Longispora albida]